MSIKQEFRKMLDEATLSMGLELADTSAEASEYAEAAIQRLADTVGMKGQEQAVRAERDSVMLVLGIDAVRSGAHADMVFRELIKGALRIGAAALTQKQ